MHNRPILVVIINVSSSKKVCNAESAFFALLKVKKKMPLTCF